ncbi:hypothetical protein C0971_12360 [Bacillus methanolicus]|uniref:hypothetical protein n=1 Tax=Bacillus methanolicus TaxID=1471 RepID=UPI00200C6DFA|nr:hypothetical protein [Bacillus methanolicus]UQD52735.1 hypothetical protein C0971_12360 [Bacillus methanolicus]
MKFVIGIEASPLIDELTDFRSLLMSETKIKEIYEHLFIFDSLIEAELAKEILNEGEIFEEWHNLIVFSDGQEGECFFDYGFITGSNQIYLFKDLLCAFSICSADEKMIEMANYQLDEHLIFKTITNEGEIYFTDRQNDELVERICQAYDIEVSFLDLDNLTKKR